MKTNLHINTYKIFVLFFCLLNGIFNSHARNLTWVASGSSNAWNNTNNWSPNIVPSTSDTVNITTAATNLVLSANQTVYRLVMQNDSMDLGGYTLTVSSSSSFTGGYISNGTLDLRGNSVAFSGTRVGATVSAAATSVKFNGSIFDQAVTADVTGSTAGDSSNGSNTFNSSFSITNSGLKPVVLSKTGRDTYNGSVTVFDTGTAVITLAYYDTSFFNGDIIVSSKGSGITFGNTSGYAKVASGKTITVGTKGFSSGTLLMNHFLQTGSTAQSFTLTSRGILNVISSDFGGAVTFTAPAITVKLSSFNGKSIFTWTGSTSCSWEGGNNFYGAVRYTNTGSGAVTMQTSGGDLYSDSVTINGGTQNFYSTTIEMTTYNGNLYFTGSNVSFSNGNGQAVFSGSANQVINGASNLPFKYLTINKTSGTVRLQCPVTVNGGLFLVTGNVVSDTINLLTIAHGATCSYASNVSFVSGPVKKIGNAAFTFPIGKGYSMSVAGISAPSGSTDAFMAEYFEGIPSVGDSLDTLLTSISECGYWDIRRTAGSSNVKITLGWDTLPCTNYMEDSIKIAVWNNNKWNQVNIDTCTINTTAHGKISSNSSMTVYGKFGIGNSFLPLLFVNFGSLPERDISDFFGYNVWDVIENKDVSLNDNVYQNAALTLSPGTLRFPAAVEANWWDWKRGTFIKDRKIGNNMYFLPEQFEDAVHVSQNPGGNGLPAMTTDFFKSIYSTGAIPIYSLNDLSSDLLYQASFLYHARQNNAPVNFMEFGGEVYKVSDYNSVTFPTGTEYGASSIEWGKKLKILNYYTSTTNYADFQIGLNAARFNPFLPTLRTTTWNNKMFAEIDHYNSTHTHDTWYPDAIIIHNYIDANINNNSTKCGTVTNPGTTAAYYKFISPFTSPVNCTDDVELIFSSPFINFAGEYGINNYKGLVNEELFPPPGNTNPAAIPSRYDIWMTEYNSNENYSVFHGSWAHGLSVALQTMIYMESTRIKKTDCFKIIGDAIYSAVFGSTDGFEHNRLSPNLFISPDISTTTGANTAAGVTLGMLAKAVKHVDKAQNLSFLCSKLPRFTSYKRYGTLVPEPLIYGWLYKNSVTGDKEIIILNLSNTGVDIVKSFTGVFPMTDMNTYEEVFCDPAAFLTGNGTENCFIDYPLTVIPETAFTTNHQYIRLFPYSITRIYKKQCSMTMKALNANVCAGSTSSIIVYGDPDLGITYTLTCPDPNITIHNPAITATGRSFTFDVDIADANQSVIFYLTSDPSCGSLNESTTVNIHEAPVLTVTDDHNQPVASEIALCATGGLEWNAVFSYPNSTPSGYHCILINSNGEGVAESDETNTLLSFDVDTSATYYIHAYDGTCAIESEPVNVIKPGLELGDDIYVCDASSIYPITNTQVTAALADLQGAFTWSIGATPTYYTANPDIVISNLINNPEIISLHVDYTNSAGSQCTLDDDFKIYQVECCPAVGNDEISNADVKALLDIFPTSGTNPSDNGTYIINNKTIYLNGRLTIDYNPDPAPDGTVLNLKLVNCTLVVSPAAEIFVGRHYTLTLVSTTINACTNMWKGIKVAESGKLIIDVNGNGDPCEINDAEYAIWASQRSNIYADQFDKSVGSFTPYLNFSRNYISLYVPPAVTNGYNDVDLRLGNMLITSNSDLLAGYFGQATTIVPGQDSYTGMYLNDMFGTVGVGINYKSWIKFDHLNNGIIATGSNLLVKNSMFENIRDYNGLTMPLNAINGTGIFASGGTLIEIGLGNSGGSSTTFNNCKIGMHVYGASTAISLNKMDEIESTGITCENTGTFPVSILNNKIFTYNTGIYLAHNRCSISFDVSGNEILSGTNSTYPLPASYGILYDGISHYFSNNHLHQLHCNTISGDFTTGMQLTGMIDNASVKNNFVDMNSSYMTKGIQIINSAGSIINSNKVFGNDIAKGTAYEFNSFNYNLLVSDNKSDKTFYGFSFLGPNPNTRFITNEIGQICASCSTTVHNIGLYLDGSAQIGTQFNINAGIFEVYNNLWKANPTSNTSLYASTFGAWNDNCTSFGAQASRFVVPTGSSGTLEFPDNSCALGGSWFITASNPTISSPSYDGDCSPYPQIMNFDITNLDRMIAWDSIASEIYEPQTKYFLSSYLFDKLDLNDSLVENDSLFGAFYDNQNIAIIGQLSHVRSEIGNIFNDDSILVNEIIQKDSLIQSLLNNKSILIDSLNETSSSDSLLYVEKIKNTTSEISNEIQNINELWSEIESTRQARIHSADSLNDLISPVEDIEINEQNLNDIYLDKIVNDDFNLDSVQLATLYFIAHQCPFLGGRSVFFARAVLRMVNDTNLFDDAVLCGGSSRLAMVRKSNESLIVKVNPNPSTGNFVFSLLNPQDYASSLLIYDALGQLVYTNEIPANETEIKVNLEKLMEGIYFYKVSVSDILIGADKIVIIK
jgi:hypothetical protein